MRPEPPSRPLLAVLGTVLAGAAIIALSIAFTFRWTIVPATPLTGAVRLDRWTGTVVFCPIPLGTSVRQLDCPK